ncbi:MAG: DUF721 domain-containing protein [Bacteroidaceae bacterium]|nr:DUF721 domain-containing protein [Bacteroidaceae bacterium]
MRRSKSESIGDIIKRYLRSEGLETPLNQRKLINSWSDVMGQAINKYTKEIYISNQTLYVKLSSPILRQELMMQRQSIVKRLNEAVKAQVITDIVFR